MDTSEKCKKKIILLPIDVVDFLESKEADYLTQLLREQMRKEKYQITDAVKQEMQDWKEYRKRVAEGYYKKGGKGYRLKEP